MDQNLLNNRIITELKDVLRLSNVKNSNGSCNAVFSVTNSKGFVPSEEYFSKDVFSKELKTYRVVEREMIAYNPSRINVGSIAVQDKANRVIVSPLYVVFETDRERLLPEYLVRFLKSRNGLDRIISHTTGTVRNTLKFDSLCRIKISLPSIEDQKRIVRNLCKIEHQSKLLFDYDEKLNQLVKSRFIEMFGDPVENPFNWPVSTIKNTSLVYGDGPFGSNLKSSDYVDDGIRVIRLGNIGQGEFIYDDESYISYDHYKKLKKYACDPGEVVIATLGDPILRACIIPEFNTPVIHKADCMYYKTNHDVILPIFAVWNLNSKSMLKLATGFSHGQTRLRINSTQVGNLPMIMPPIDLQLRFKEFVTKIENTKLLAHQAIDKLQLLYDKLAQEYFWVDE